MQDELNTETATDTPAIAFTCPHCQSTVDVNEHLLGTTVECPNPECGQPFTAKAPVGQPVVSSEGDAKGGPDYEINRVATDDEEMLEKVHPSMWRRRPFRFVSLWLLFLGGIGLAISAYLMRDTWFDWGVGLQATVGLGLAGAVGIALLVWYITVKFTKLTVTNKRTIYREGIISREISEIRHEDVRNLQIDQNAFERIMSVGDIGISSAGQEDIEIEARHIPHPDKIADTIRSMQ